MISITLLTIGKRRTNSLLFVIATLTGKTLLSYIGNTVFLYEMVIHLEKSGIYFVPSNLNKEAHNTVEQEGEDFLQTLNVQKKRSKE